MITIKTEQDIEILREGGKRLAEILREVSAMVKPGVHTKDLNDRAHQLAIDGGDKSAIFLYRPVGASRPYPASICVSVNDEVVHGIPNEHNRILKEGDIVSLDMALTHRGLVTDSAVTVPVGKIDEKLEKLLKDTQKALDYGISAAQSGKHVGDIGYAVERFIRPLGYGLVEDLCGHGVGYKVHEDPFVPNFGNKGQGEKLRPGMVIAIEPMVNMGTGRIKLDSDDYTYRTQDGQASAHFEHTIVITKAGPEILTI
ncbi:MAG: type I methionyl aminopeptidase [bacterium]